MTDITPDTAAPSTPDTSGVESGTSADGMPVARVGDFVFAMVPARDGQYFLASAWRVTRPFADLKRDDFYSHHGRIENELAFHARMLEQAEHNRELAGLSRRTARIHCNTPWGPSQGATIYAEGVIAHTAAGHGGFKLSGNRNAQVHPMLRSQDGWYEEDSAWAAVAVAFPDLFTGFEQRCAARTLKDWEPDAWETISGTRLAPGESHTKDRRVFEQQHANDWIVISALRSDHHAGMTEVIATRGGRRDHGVEERRFLVPSADYKAGCFGLVIDEARHAVYEGPSSFASWTGRAVA
ncbi:DUF7007 domain-containing protein [Agrobacterium tumefaciens]|uniref:DUF7007 domain-containing protein n=1 Tax=Agrobacterium tumefaciens TaxID=358 RepID=UPI00097827C6|nr:hypothetical protein BV900_26760 [Agrobacterium tumefaciens]